MTTLLTTELIEKCHAGSRAKGFWDETPDQRQQLMLMIGELAEAQEAHRKGRMRKSTDLLPELLEVFDPLTFDAYLKDNVPDELADSFIRGCDFVAGFGSVQDALDGYRSAHYHYTENEGIAYSLPENFGACLFDITARLTNAWGLRKVDAYQIGQGLADIQRLAERGGIDLATHIDLKLRYNATRGYKHEKAY